MSRRKLGGNETANAVIDKMTNELFNTNEDVVGGGKNKKKRNTKANKKGGVNIAPFLSALALLGTRIINDPRFSNNINPLKNILKTKKQSIKRRFHRKLGGEGDENNDPPLYENEKSVMDNKGGDLDNEAKVKDVLMENVVGGAKRRTRKTKSKSPTRRTRKTRSKSPAKRRLVRR